jgi:DNA-binding CsgD family transcriptional regulator
MPQGVIVVDEQARVVLVNRAARAIVAKDDGLRVGGTDLSAATHEETAQLHTLIRRAAGGEGGQVHAMKVSRPSNRPALSILVTPTCANGGKPATWPGAAAVLFINDPDHVISVNEEALCRLYGFTHAEARLSGLLLRGATLGEASRQLGVSINTARTHMKRLFAKSGARRQADFVRLLAIGPGIVTI